MGTCVTGAWIPSKVACHGQYMPVHKHRQSTGVTIERGCWGPCENDYHGSGSSPASELDRDESFTELVPHGSRLLQERCCRAVSSVRRLLVPKTTGRACPLLSIRKHILGHRLTASTPQHGPPSSASLRLAHCASPRKQLTYRRVMPLKLSSRQLRPSSGHAACYYLTGKLSRTHQS